LAPFRIEEAAKSLQFARGKSYNIDEELNEIVKQSEAKNNQINAQSSGIGCSSSLSRIFSSAFGKPFMVIGILYLIGCWAPYTILMINMINIFEDSATSIPSDQAPIFVGVLQVCSQQLE